MKKKTKDTKQRVTLPPPPSVSPSALPAKASAGFGGLTHGLLVNNTEHSDFSIVVAAAKKETIAAHEVFLSFRGVQGLLSPSSLCSSVSKKAGHTTAVISEPALVFCNVSILLTMLRFVYTSDVSAIEASDDLPFLVNLLATVSAAGLGDRFIAKVVEDKVMSLTTTSTVHMLIARTYEYKLDRLHFQIRAFAFANWSSFISDKDGCRRVGVELLSKLSAANAKPDAPPPFASPAQADQLLVDMSSMLTSASASGDLVLECAKEGHAFGHRCVVAAFCEGFRAEVAQAALMSPSTKKKTTAANSGKTEIRLQSQNHLLSVAAANALLHFIYCGNAGFSQEIAVNLILALSDYKVALLEAACEASIQKPCTLATAFPILDITFHPNWVARPSMGPLRKTVTDFIVENFKDLDLNMWSELPPVLFHALQALQRSQSRMRVSVASAAPTEAPSLSGSSPGIQAVGSSLPSNESVTSVSAKPSQVSVSTNEPAIPAKPAVFVADEVSSGVSDSEEEN